MTSPPEYAPPADAAPPPSCELCRAAGRARARAHMAGSPEGVAEATEVIRSHPHGAGDQR
ncbi:hypothetical protein [Streptomyces sp. NPDC048111]|uniref:hypothetical protein n=1 Tax=Streptomyces sp. NPDC048111 TaxID=3365500 RepID=UPI003718C2D8